MDTSKLYETTFVRRLFDEMSRTYGTVNSISSFGFCFFWRVQCAELLEYRKGETVLDLMSGMSELAITINKRNDGLKFLSVDVSPAMCKLAAKSVGRQDIECRIIEGDALDLPIEDNSIDHVVSTFGLKTFSAEQLRRLADECFRVIRPGGSIGFLEISVPENFILKSFYMFYLQHLIPIIGRVFLGNPDNYRYLAVYTSAFANCDQSIEWFRDAGFEVEPQSFFFGCATGFRGRKLV